MSVTISKCRIVLIGLRQSFKSIRGMMEYSELSYLSNGEFKRLCGVSRNTFGERVEILRPHLDRAGRKGGQNKLDVENQLLLGLEYWREYRSQFHIGVSWD